MTCIIDGSHMRATDLQYLIIREALARTTLKLDREDREVYERAAHDFYATISDLSLDDLTALDFLMDTALEALDDETEGVWWVDESALWHVSQEERESDYV